MEVKTVNYYDWFEDIKPFLCKHIGIDERNFSQYHKVVSPDAKDKYYNLWHVWLKFFGENLRNDSFDKVYLPSFDADSEWDSLRTKVIKDHGEWAVTLIDAAKELSMAVDPNPKDEFTTIVIWYSW